MQKILGSFKDPSGFLFWKEKKLHRTIAHSYFQHYDHLIQSNLYKKLVEKKLLISHTEEKHLWSDKQRIITPTIIPFISYPYEWCFSQLKDAALLTLEILEESLLHGMILKDASAYNVQFLDGKPIFIDTLSFEIYKKGSPWIAYKQFCEHFLAPLALMSYTDVRLSTLLKTYINGIPLDLASKLLPKKTYFKLPLLLHIHLHARSQKRYENKTTKNSSSPLSITQLKGIIDNLKNGVLSCSYTAVGTEWAEYYQDDSYSNVAFEDKKKIVKEFLLISQPQTTWDMGANDGTFSKLAALHSELVISLDYDPACVEKNYKAASKTDQYKTLPLLMDLTNPSSAIGWNNKERFSLFERPHPDCILALALIHHLSIAHNIPLDYSAQFFSRITKWLVIEFVPKEDKKVQTLLKNRNDIFNQYNQKTFESVFKNYFEIITIQPIQDSLRTLYLMKVLKLKGI